MTEMTSTTLANTLKSLAAVYIIMTKVEVIDSTNNVVSKFERNIGCDGVSWTQSFQNQTMTYQERIVDENNVELYDRNTVVSLCYDPCVMYMHIDAGKRVRMFPDCEFKLTHDDNDDIMRLLGDRLALGKQRYGHGVRIDDDTRQWGTDIDSWETMMMEEALDGMIYAAAQLLRIKRRTKS